MNVMADPLVMLSISFLGSASIVMFIWWLAGEEL